MGLIVILVGATIGLAGVMHKASLAYDSPVIATTVRTNSSHTIGYYGIAQVSCNSNESLTGGGYYSSQWHELLSVYRNGPSDDGKAWQVEMMYVAPHYYGAGPSFTAYAVCAKTLW